ncbi:hypothetical protein Pcinc_016834 [Petrolisthes cinctipes]|uniref:Uncharacterized protein n=1 Tax=Petrolisthes cinctipes TaxID=88211 RepID=A0AAE1FQI1_PETCI|nr:hypothetical protein Pcinc_016834 [Petrolisthes cinctipes]
MLILESSYVTKRNRLLLISVTRHVLRTYEIGETRKGKVPIPEPDVIMESSSNPESSDAASSDESGAYKSVNDDQPMPLTQAELNDLTRDLNLSKESAQLVGSRIREKSLNPIELSAWLCLKSVIGNFLGNHRSLEYEKTVDELMESVRMSVKMHFLRSHLDFFSNNCGDFSEEQGERFHKGIRVMEECYQGRWDVNFLADYCWWMKRDVVSARKSVKRPFIPE